MKIKATFLALMLILGLTGNVWAERITCEKGTGGTFTVEVPQGWKYSKIQGGCTIDKADGSGHFISIAYYKNGSLNARVFAEQMCNAMKVEPKYLTHEDNYTSMLVKLDGKEVRIGISSEGKGEGAQVITTYPEDSDELDKIFDSVD
ncbi:MAG: hypothetical protein IJU76_00100 [Desulfovibrionaceae bacterium]|nr:hypothetical protein [Desulfovibrionaceae bacterium]